jgi:hypothetical protein
MIASMRLKTKFLSNRLFARTIDQRTLTCETAELNDQILYIETLYFWAG